jgi:hypothetical protein
MLIGVLAIGTARKCRSLDINREFASASSDAFMLSGWFHDARF